MGIRKPVRSAREIGGGASGALAPFADAGAPFADAGAPFADAGAPFADAGAPFADAGAPFADAGAPFADAGAPCGCRSAVCCSHTTRLRTARFRHRGGIRRAPHAGRSRLRRRRDRRHTLLRLHVAIAVAAAEAESQPNSEDGYHNSRGDPHGGAPRHREAARLRRPQRRACLRAGQRRRGRVWWGNRGTPCARRAGWRSRRLIA